jgi:hypothetical protein
MKRAVLLLVLTLAATGTVGWWLRRAPPHLGSWVVPSHLEFVPPDEVDAGPPTRVRIPAIRVDSGLESLALGADGALQPPKQYGLAGFYAQGAMPGDDGPAVIAGHVDSKTGPAVFYRLRELTTGATVDVQRGGAWLHFSVTAVERYPKNAFPTQKVYGPTPLAELRLITCGGTFDDKRNSYRDNVVVYAVLRSN